MGILGLGFRQDWPRKGIEPNPAGGSRHPSSEPNSTAGMPLLDRFAATVLKMTGRDFCAIARLADDGTALTPLSVMGNSRRAIQKGCACLSQQAVRMVVETRQPLVSNEFGKQCSKAGSRDVSGVGYFIAVPVRDSLERSLGVLCLGELRDRWPSVEEVNTVEELSTIAALGMENASASWILPGASGSSKETNTLLTILENVNSALPISVAVDRCFAALTLLTGADRYAIWLLNESLPRLSLVFAAEGVGVSVPADYWRVLDAVGNGPFVRGVARNRLPATVGDATEDPRLGKELSGLLGQASLLALPLSVRDVVLGVAMLAAPRGAALLDPHILPICQAALNTLAAAIDSARLAEREKMAQQAKGEFMSVVSHELKTPLTSISGYAQLLSKRLPPDSDESLRNYLTVIMEKTRHLTQLINHLLDVRHSGTSHLVDPQEVNLAQIVISSVEAMQALTSRHRLVVDAPEELTLRGDPFRLRQVVDHILTNAIKYSPKGGVINVRLCVEEHQSTDRQWREAVVSVADPGIGISPMHLPYIFQRFYQADLSGSRHFGGLGLGLNISQQIIEEHGGRIWVESRAGVGSNFCFSLPLP